MRTNRLLSTIALLGLPLTGFAGQIDFRFDNTVGGGVTPPYAGSGTFTFSTDPGDGTSPLAAFGAYSFTFTLGPDTFTTADLTTTPATVLVILSTLPTGRDVHFSNTNLFGDGGHSGSMDFVNGFGYLSFEPPGFVGGNLDLYVTEDLFGNYVSVPEPGAGWYPITGLALLLARRRR